MRMVQERGKEWCRLEKADALEQPLPQARGGGHSCTVEELILNRSRGSLAINRKESIQEVPQLEGGLKTRWGLWTFSWLLHLSQCDRNQGHQFRVMVREKVGEVQKNRSQERIVQVGRKIHPWIREIEEGCQAVLKAHLGYLVKDLKWDYQEDVCFTLATLNCIRESTG